MLLEFANDLQALLKKSENLERALSNFHAERDQLEELIDDLKITLASERKKAASLMQHVLYAAEVFNKKNADYDVVERGLRTEAVQEFIALIQKEIK